MQNYSPENSLLSLLAYRHSLAQAVPQATVSLSTPRTSSLKLADHPLQVLLQVEVLRVIHPNGFHTQLQSANTTT